MSLSLGRFLLEDRIGRGSVGEVWRGRHRDHHLPVAVKILAADVPESEGAALQNEARAVAALDHPGVVQVLDQGRVGPDDARASGGDLLEGAPFLVMELVGGGTLHAEVGRCAWPRMRGVLLRLLDALAHAHAHGLVHRDIKPGNVLRAAGGSRVVLTDFGLAALLEAAQGDDELIRGTPAYMSPEQLRGRWRELGPWTDLYGLGCLAWALATGSPPFGRKVQDALRAHVHDEPPPLQSALPVPDGFEDWLRLLLAKDPRDRFERAADAARALALLPDPAGSPLPEPLTPIEDDSPVTSVLDPVITGVFERRHAAPPRGRAVPVPDDWRRPDDWLRPGLRVASGRGLVGIRSLHMVDREPERSLLWEALQRVAETGTPEAVILRGPMGLGKSRLASWLGVRAHELGCVHVVTALHAPDGGPGTGLGGAVARAVRGLGLSPEALTERVDDELGDVLSAEDRASLVELAAPGSGAPGARLVRPQWRHALLRRWLRTLADRRPVLLWLDDVQWGDDAIAFARTLLEEDADLPVLVVATAQSEALATQARATAELVLLQEAGGQVVDIGPLPAEHHQALVGQLLGLAPALAGQVVRRTAGNPMFAEQLVRHWVERDLLVPTDAGQDLRPGARAEIPPGVVEVWGQRLGGLLDHRPAEEGESLELAAVMGQSVELASWRRACAAAHIRPALGRVEVLLAERLLVSHDAHRSGFSFVHGMVRECLVERARTGGRLVRWHAACAEALEAETGDDALDRRARHLVKAGAFQAAQQPLLDAARARAWSGQHENAGALMALRRAALDALRVPASDPCWGEQMVTEAWLATLANQYDRAHRLAEDALAGGWEHRWPHSIAGANRVLGVTLRHQGRAREAARHLDAAVRLWQRLDQPVEEARSWQVLGDVRTDLGELDEAVACFGRAEQAYTPAGEAGGLAHCLVGRALIARQRGQLGEAADLLRTARGRFLEAGDRWGEAVCVNDLADLARLQGRLDEAEAGYREARERYLAMGHRPVVPDINRGLLLGDRGRHDLAVALLDPLADYLRAAERGPWLLHVQAGLLRSLAFLGNRGRSLLLLAGLERDLDREQVVDEELATLIQEAARHAAAAGWPDLGVRAAQVAASQWRGLGRLDEAERLRPEPG